MKRFLCSMLTLLVLIVSLSVPAFAADESRTFSFDLSVDGGAEKAVSAGDVITVTFTLRRTDAAEDYTMYAMQNEILYDPAFFQLVEGGTITASGIETRDLGLRDGGRALYMNYVSLSGGDTWKAETLIGSFQLKVLGTEGSSAIRSSSCFVYTQDGQEHYASTQQDAAVTLSGGSGCLVRFESNGGSSVPDQTVPLGGKVRKPADPTKDGFALEGWYSDMDLQHRWDFQKDTVSGNMTLYAKWEAPRQADLLWLLLLLLVIVIVVLIVLGRKHARRKAETPQPGANSSPEHEKEERKQ